MISSWRLAGSSSRFVVGSAGHAPPPSFPFFFFFFFLPSLCSRYPRRWLDGLRIASSCLRSPGHLPSPDIISLFLSLICYQLTVVRCVSLAGSLFLHNLAIYFGQFVRLYPFSMSNARAILRILQVLISFVVLIVYYRGRTYLYCKRVGIRILLAFLWCSTVLAVSPTPPAWLFAYWGFFAILSFIARIATWVFKVGSTIFAMIICFYIRPFSFTSACAIY